jgi:hypothetical protein
MAIASLLAGGPARSITGVGSKDYLAATRKHTYPTSCDLQIT